MGGTGRGIGAGGTSRRFLKTATALRRPRLFLFLKTKNGDPREMASDFSGNLEFSILLCSIAHSLLKKDSHLIYCVLARSRF